MLIRNEICENLKTKFQEELQATILLDDILTYDISHAPFVVIKQNDTNITSPTSDSWKHTLGLECEIITTSKANSDELLESLLKSLESFKGVKNITGINVEKVQVASSEAFSVSLEFEMIYFTPSYRA